MDLFTWYVIRASGLVAWSLVCASVVWGLLLTTRVLGSNPRPPWLLDLHRFLGGLSVVFVGLHVGGLLLDRYVPFSPVDVLVPFASRWHPVPVAFGIVAMYLVVAIEITSLLMKRLPRRVWRRVHMSSFVLFGCAAAHGFFAGTDRASAYLQGGLLLGVTLFVFLFAYRQLNPRRKKTGAARTGAAPVRRPVGAAAGQVAAVHASGGRPPAGGRAARRAAASRAQAPPRRKHRAGAATPAPARRPAVDPTVTAPRGIPLPPPPPPPPSERPPPPWLEPSPDHSYPI